MMSKRLCGFITLLAVLTACDLGTPDGVPTLAQLPAQVEIAQVTDDEPAAASSRAQADGRPTLPATFTPSTTFTPTSTSTASPTVTVTPSPTITDTPTATATDLPTIVPQDRPSLGLLEQALRATVLPTDFFEGAATNPIGTPLPPGVPSPLPALDFSASPGATQGTSCAFAPPGGFGTVYANNPGIATQLGCPSSAPGTQSIVAAWQNFQGGTMIWLNGDIYALTDNGSTFRRFDDTFQDGVDPESSSETAPDGLFTPVRGFLKVWSRNPNIRNALGWAIHSEQGVTATVSDMPGGLLVWLPGRPDILVLLTADGNSGVWRSFSGAF